MSGFQEVKSDRRSTQGLNSTQWNLIKNDNISFKNNILLDKMGVMLCQYMGR